MYVKYKAPPYFPITKLAAVTRRLASDLPLEALQLCYVEARIPPNIYQDFDTPLKFKQRLGSR